MKESFAVIPMPEQPVEIARAALRNAPQTYQGMWFIFIHCEPISDRKLVPRRLAGHFGLPGCQ
jgi:predicted ATPase